MDKDTVFIKNEIRKIEIDKWIEGVKRNGDPGNSYVMEWILLNAKEYREKWDISLCKVCGKCEECGYNILSACDGHIKCD